MSEAIREVVAVFDDAEDLERAVFELETHGFDRAAFSLLATEHAVKEKLGREYQRVEEMVDRPDAPRETFFSRVSRIEAELGIVAGLASLGGLAAAGLSASVITIPMLIAAGAGAAVGAVFSGSLHCHHAQRLQEQLSRGGLVLWVSVRNPEQEQKALEVLRAQPAHDVHVHEFSQAGP